MNDTSDTASGTVDGSSLSADDIRAPISSPPRESVTIVEEPTLTRRIILVLILVLTVFLVGGLGYVLISGVLAPSTPRTAAERQLRSLETAAEENPGENQVLADYARALIGSGQYATASRVIQSGKDSLGSTPALLVEEARLAFATDDPDTLAILEQAYAALDAERAETEAERAERGITGGFTDKNEELLIEAALIEGAVHVKAENWDLAIAAYTKALDRNKTMADVMVLRGESYVMIGASEDARADFERALEFAPEYEPALLGLESIAGDAQ